MRESPPFAALPAPMARRRNLILASAGSGVLFIFVGIVVNFRFSDIAKDDVWSLVAMFTSLLGPFLGLSAVLMAGKDLETIRKGIIPASLRGMTQWGRILGIIGTGANSILLLMFIAQAFSVGGVDPIKDSMIQDLNKLFVHAYQYRIQPASNGGGEGAYVGYGIPAGLAQNENGFYRARVIHADTSRFIAVWREDSATAIVVKLGPDGRPIEPWVFYGEFRE